jgi:hypothetical protein
MTVNSRFVEDFGVGEWGGWDGQWEVSRPEKMWGVVPISQGQRRAAAELMMSWTGVQSIGANIALSAMTLDCSGTIALAYRLSGVDLGPPPATMFQWYPGSLTPDGITSRGHQSRRIAIGSGR